MTRILLVAAVVVALGACKKEDGGEAVLAKLADFEKQMCACTDEACAKKVRADLDAYEKGGAMKKPSDKQMSKVLDTEHKIETCEGKYVLSETGAKSLELMKAGLATAKQKVAEGKYADAGFDCSVNSAESFRREYGAYADSKPDIKAFLDEYIAYCREGMHLEAATALAAKAEASRKTTPKGSIPEASKPDISLAEVKLKEVPGAAEKLKPIKERYEIACGGPPPD
jgi:hypothetical protein